MLYIFRTPFKSSNGTIYKDAVFVDDINAEDEVAQEVKRRLEEKEPERPKRKRTPKT